MRRDEALLEACSQIHEGNSGTAIEVVLDNLEVFPKLVRSVIVIPELLKAAANSKMGRQPFCRDRGRPQIIEAIQCPRTWMYGSRIGVWSFSERKYSYPYSSSEPRVLIVIGEGPEPLNSEVSAIVHDLASERDSDSDLVVTGFCRFDLNDEGKSGNQSERWPASEFVKAVERIALSHGAQDVVELVGTEYVKTLAPQVLRPTVGLAKQALERLEQETGFVTNSEFDMASIVDAEADLLHASKAATRDPMPVLAEYRLRGEPLEIELTTVCLGIEDYERVAREYTRTVQRQRVDEWERRRRIYEDWYAGSIQEWRRLKQMNSHDLQNYTVFVHWTVNFETAQRERVDPPIRRNGLDRLGELPKFIVDNLAWWALAEHRIEVVSKHGDFQRWMQSCLLDAFLRGRCLPERDQNLKLIYDSWQRSWRPIALHALDSALRRCGITLSDIAVEQTLFRVVKKTNTKVTLRVLHIWDPSVDSVPELSKPGVTLYRSRFAGRREKSESGREAQAHAIELLNEALARVPQRWPDLVTALSMDSGRAIDRLMSQLAEPLQKQDLHKEIEKLQAEALEIDAFLKFQFQQKLQAVKTINDIVTLAQQCAREGRRKKAVPDFLGWALFLMAEAVQNGIEDLASSPKYESLLLLKANLHTLARYDVEQLLPSYLIDLNLEAVKRMKGFSPWQIVGAAASAGPEAEAIDAILKNFCGGQPVEPLGPLLALLRSKNAAYAERCLDSEGPPPISDEQEKCSAPNCFTDWKLVCYYIAFGDAALAFRRILEDGIQGNDKGVLQTLIERAKSMEIPPAFPDLHGRRRKLVEDVTSYVSAGDLVSLEFATRRIRKESADLLDEAEGAYHAAAVRDRRYGVAWLRLAGLKWMTKQYRGALYAIIGPSPVEDLHAGHFPLAVAVRLAGGQLSFSPSRGKQDDTWMPENATLAVDGPNVSGKLIVSLREYQANTDVERCVISDLCTDDAQLLAAFFRKYELDMFHSTGTAGFEQWLSLIQIPSLGFRGGVAAAMEQGARFAVLAAGAYLGISQVLDIPGISDPFERPRTWLDTDVITALQW